MRLLVAKAVLVLATLGIGHHHKPRKELMTPLPGEYCSYWSDGMYTYKGFNDLTGYGFTCKEAYDFWKAIPDLPKGFELEKI